MQESSGLTPSLSTGALRQLTPQEAQDAVSEKTSAVDQKMLYIRDGIFTTETPRDTSIATGEPIPATKKPVGDIMKIDAEACKRLGNSAAPSSPDGIRVRLGDSRTFPLINSAVHIAMSGDLKPMTRSRALVKIDELLKSFCPRETERFEGELKSEIGEQTYDSVVFNFADNPGYAAKGRMPDSDGKHSVLSRLIFGKLTQDAGKTDNPDALASKLKDLVNSIAQDKIRGTLQDKTTKSLLKSYVKNRTQSLFGTIRDMCQLEGKGEGKVSEALRDISQRTGKDGHALADHLEEKYQSNVMDNFSARVKTAKKLPNMRNRPTIFFELQNLALFNGSGIKREFKPRS